MLHDLRYGLERTWNIRRDFTYSSESDDENSTDWLFTGKISRKKKDLEHQNS